MQNINLARNVVNQVTSENGLYVDLTEKNAAVISYLTTQLVTNPRNTSVSQNSRNIDHSKELQIRNSTLMAFWKYVLKNQKMQLISEILYYIVLTAKDYPNQRKSTFLNNLGSTSSDIVDKIDDVLEGKPEHWLPLSVRTS